MLILGAIGLGLGIAVAVWRVRAASSFLTVLAAAPIVFLFLFLLNTPVERLVFPTAESRAATARVRASTPVVFLLFDEFPVIDLQDKTGAIDAKRFPNFARLAASSTWFRNTTTLSASTTVAVPVILTGNPPKRGALPIAHDYPNNLFTLLGGRYRMKVTEVQTRLCPARLCKEKSQNVEKRLSSLYSDARTVYLHLIAPPTLEERLPAIDESWGDFGSGSAAGIESEPEAATKLPKVDLKTFYRGRVQLVQPLRLVVPRLREAARRRSTSCTCCCRTRRGSSSRTGACARWRPSTRPGGRASAGGARSSRCRPGSGTSCRSATRTGCSGSSSTACTRPGSGTRRS